MSLLLHIYAFSTPDYEPFNTIWKSTLVDSLTHYKGEYELCHTIKRTHTITTNKNTVFRDPNWQKAVKQRVELWKKALVAEFPREAIIILSDCDIQFFPKNGGSWNALIEWFSSQPKKIGFMREGFSENFNIGFIIIKADYIEYFLRIIDEALRILTLHTDLPFGDQTAFHALQSAIDFDFIPARFIIYGQDKMRYHDDNALLHHATCAKTRDDKYIQMQAIKNIVEQKIDIPSPL